ncbi:DeoR family transcriptional regulator [Alginatibacterium sediminis]|uniref:DeoR family transcriptional regulator n=1 Tax=Alginatibacterium sediminis TaxID=2164068 RepID=A0A420EHQ1_9ALTE|nr:DeoR family transcriptional regulator [Alginatibacterium sediminis]RKF20086.1 DeoR family transcriptional regulator [Alginatibacterium sediminis]
MTRRNTQQRRQSIVSLIVEKHELSVDVLAKQFETSQVTIRKDLAALEKLGLLLRRYGGAIALPQKVDSVPIVVDKTTVGSITKSKLLLASAAAELIQDNSRIVIDSGSTTMALVEQLADKKDLVVMTNTLELANAISKLKNEPTLLMTGGTWDTHSESFQGQVAESVLRSYDFDQLFIGADGIDLNRGTTSFNELLGLSKVMAEVSKQVIVLIESEKFGKKIPNLELAWDSIDILLSDRGLSDQAAQQIQSHGVEVIRV